VGAQPMRSWPRLRMLNAVIVARRAVSIGHSDTLGHRGLYFWFDMCVGC
jgi:hypothetical protein